MIAQPSLLAKGLSRSYGEYQAVRPLDLELNPGEITILTGPNGAGKSTLLLCLSGLLLPSQGQILIDGFDLYQQERQAKQRLAFVSDVPQYYPALTSLEHVRFIGLAFKVEAGWEDRAHRLLNEFGLWESRNMYPHNLSRGMRLKLGIVLALSRPFKVLLMDEPTSALDAQSVAILVSKLVALRDEGRAVMLSSHDLSLVDLLHGRHLSMDQGRVEVS
jgi:ABC-2 type transport system ATP-binding protein